MQDGYHNADAAEQARLILHRILHPEDQLDVMARASLMEALERTLGRIQTAEDVANVVGFLISPAADYLTGACIMADGGCMVGCGSASK